MVIDGLEFGGGERSFLQLIAGLDDRFKVFVATSPGRKFAKMLDQMDRLLCPVNMSCPVSLTPIFKLRKFIRQKRIDIVHSQGARADFFARMASLLMPTSCLCTLQMPVEGFDVNSWRRRTYQAMDRISGRAVKKYIVVSEALKKNLSEERKISSDRIALIYNGIELDRYVPISDKGLLKKTLKMPSDTFLVGTIGRLVWQKGYEFLIKAIPEIVRVFPEARFLFVGEGPLKGKLGALSKELGIRDKIIFTGFRSDIKEILSAIDLVVIPSLLEGFPMITLEAMALAKPIVATRINGITEQITNNKNGILVPAKNDAALAEAILDILLNKGKSRKLGLAARLTVESKFSVEKMVAETEKIYCSLLGAERK